MDITTALILTWILSPLFLTAYSEIQDHNRLKKLQKK